MTIVHYMCQLCLLFVPSANIKLTLYIFDSLIYFTWFVSECNKQYKRRFHLWSDTMLWYNTIRYNITHCSIIDFFNYSLIYFLHSNDGLLNRNQNIVKKKKKELSIRTLITFNTFMPYVTWTTESGRSVCASSMQARMRQTQYHWNQMIWIHCLSFHSELLKRIVQLII